MIQAPKLACIYLLGHLLGKSRLSLENSKWSPFFKMAAIIGMTTIIKFDTIVRFSWSSCSFICVWGCRCWIYNNKATQKLAPTCIIYSRSAGNKNYIGLYHKKGNFSISSIFYRKIDWKCCVCTSPGLLAIEWALKHLIWCKNRSLKCRANYPFLTKLMFSLATNKKLLAISSWSSSCCIISG